MGYGRLRFFVHTAKSIGNAVVMLLVNAATQHLQSLAVSWFVGVQLRRAVQRLTGLSVFTRGIIELEQLEQSAAVLVLTIRGIKKFHQVFREPQRGQTP